MRSFFDIIVLGDLFMMLLIGLFIIPFSAYLINEAKNYKTTVKKRRLINISIVLISILFIYITFLVNQQPFKFDIESGRDYLLYTFVIFIFTPLLWINLGYFVFGVTKQFRIRKNAKAKSKDEYLYYRETLNKLSPGLLMYIRSLDVDVKKAISSSILKLKLTKNIIEKKNGFEVIKTDNLLESEKMIIDLIQNNHFNDKKYIEVLRKESVENGYIRKNFGNLFIRIIKIIFTILIPVIATIESIKFDSYVYDNYKTYIYEGKRYVLIGDEIGDIHFDHPDNYEDYYHGYVKELKSEFYDKSLVRANMYSNKIVKKTMIMQSLDGMVFTAIFITDILAIYLLIEQLIYIKHNYKRTRKGVDIINKSYAFKNFLKDFSIISKRNEKELIMWEYYLVYAVALGVNEKINDKVINKYIK